MFFITDATTEVSILSFYDNGRGSNVSGQAPIIPV